MYQARRVDKYKKVGLKETTEVDVLVEPLRVVPLLVPLRFPGADDAQAEPDRMDFLTHFVCLSDYARAPDPSSTYTWLVFFSTR